MYFNAFKEGTDIKEAKSLSFAVYDDSIGGHLRPAAELHLTLLGVERKPCDVYLTGTLEHPGRHIQTRAVVVDHHVGPKRAVELFIGAANTR